MHARKPRAAPGPDRLIWANHRPLVAITDPASCAIGRLADAIADQAKICAKRPRKLGVNGE